MTYATTTSIAFNALFHYQPTSDDSQPSFGVSRKRSRDDDEDQYESDDDCDCDASQYDADDEKDHKINITRPSSPCDCGDDHPLKDSNARYERAVRESKRRRIAPFNNVESCVSIDERIACYWRKPSRMWINIRAPHSNSTQAVVVPAEPQPYTTGVITPDLVGDIFKQAVVSPAIHNLLNPITPPVTPATRIIRPAIHNLLNPPISPATPEPILTASIERKSSCISSFKPRLAYRRPTSTPTFYMAYPYQEDRTMVWVEQQAVCA